MCLSAARLASGKIPSITADESVACLDPGTLRERTSQVLESGTSRDRIDPFGSMGKPEDDGIPERSVPPLIKCVDLFWLYRHAFLVDSLPRATAVLAPSPFY